MKVAFATQDLHTVDAHFAGARHFAIYDVDADGHRLIEAVGFDEASNQDGTHAEAGDDRITPRVEALDGCALLFVLAIGGPAAAKVVNHQIHPVKLPAPEPIPQVLERVRTMLNGSPPPWLRKALGRHAASPRELRGESDDA
ncbi:MAG: nitrogen fixation protein NifX [Rhodospirillales bacterium]|jgi:nitrogen fixation protein NifX|nr:nitrogen fixation protein NifX [Rhodospirillales bacterium]